MTMFLLLEQKWFRDRRNANEKYEIDFQKGDTHGIVLGVSGRITCSYETQALAFLSVGAVNLCHVVLS